MNSRAPEYLLELVPPSAGAANLYNLRSNLNIPLQKCRTATFFGSYFPATTRLWNSLDPNSRLYPDISSFKSQLQNKFFNSKKIPSYFLYGDRLVNIHHARLRYNCSSLNADLFRANLISSPSCSCGYQYENAEHYFFHCTKYNVPRDVLLNNLHSVELELNDLDVNVNVQLLLSGSENLSHDINVVVFSLVQQYIKATHRFS